MCCSTDGHSDTRTDGQGFFDSSVAADSECLFFMGSEMSPKVHTLCKGVNISNNNSQRKNLLLSIPPWERQTFSINVL